MGTKLSNAPVYYTVAQVRFNPVLDLDGYVPAIQSKMREAHFPDYRKEVFQQLVLPFGNGEQGQMAAPTVTPQSRYLFGDIDGRSLFLLETNALSLQTTRYDTFETFSQTLLKGLGILHDALRLDFVERMVCGTWMRSSRRKMARLSGNFSSLRCWGMPYAERGSFSTRSARPAS